MDKTKVLFVSQEILPYSPESKMAEMARLIPQTVHENGKDIRIFMPRYGKVNERRHQLHEVIRLSGMNMIVDDTDHPLIIKVASIPQVRIQVYFIDNEEYFHRKAFFSDDIGKLFPDNDMRMIFFAKGVLETVKKLGWAPDIIHCHGWFTSLLPLYVKKVFHNDPHYADSKVVFSIYDDKFSGSLDKKITKKIAFDNVAVSDMESLSHPTHAGLMKLGVQYADGVIINDENMDTEVEQWLIKSGVPVLRQFDELDPLAAIDDFFDSVNMSKSVLVD